MRWNPFGGDDPLEDLLDEEGTDDGDVDRLPREDEWKYSFEPLDTDKVAGREMYTTAENEVYAGEEVRQMMEARRYHPNAYTWFGYTKDPNRGVEEAGVPYNALFKHSALFGQSGYGKSTVMQNMMQQWIQAEYGVCFIDPKGDDSPEMLESIPEHRRDEVLWVEPGVADRDSVIGFNFFDTYAEHGTADHTQEAEQITDEFVSLLEVFARDWSPQMTSTAKAIVEQLVKAEEDYTPIDFYQILDKAVERDAFLEMYGKQMEDIERDLVEDFNPQEMQPLIGQVEQIATKPVRRELLADRDSSMSIAEAIEDGKVILANISNLSEGMEFVTAALVRQIWSTIKARSGTDEHKLSPYYLVIDEFKDVTKQFEDDPDQLKIEEIFSKARSLRLSVMVATQQPSQLPEDIKESVYKTQNLFSFNTGDWQDASEIAKGIGDIDVSQLQELGMFKVLGRLTIDGDTTEGLLIHTFPKYPPLRTEREAEDLKQYILKKHGSPKKGSLGDMSENYGVNRYLGEKSASTVSVGDTELTVGHILAAIASAQARETYSFRGYDDWVAREDFEAILERHLPEVPHDEIMSEIVRPVTGGEIEQVEENNIEYFRLTDAGREDIFTGTHSGAEGDLALAALQYLSKMGQFVTLPKDDDDAVFFDAEAEPPIKPTSEAETMAEAQTLHRALRASFSEIADRFSDSTVLIDANPTPLFTPRQFAASMATRDNRHVVFAVPETTASDVSSPISPPEFVERLLTGGGETPAFVKHQDDNGYRTFYNTERRVGLDNGGFALASAKTEWCERGRKREITLVDENGEALTSFSSFEDIQYNTPPEKFSAYCAQDADGNWVVRDPQLELESAEGEDEDEVDTNANDGETIDADEAVDNESTGEPEGEFDNETWGDEEESDDEGDRAVIDTFSSLEEVRAAGYHLVYEPLVPESVLSSPTPDPSHDSWTIFVVPDDGDPYIYDGDAEPSDLSSQTTTSDTDGRTPAEQEPETHSETEYEEPEESDDSDPEESGFVFGDEANDLGDDTS